MSTPQPELRRERRVPVRTIGAVSASVIAFPLLVAPAEAATIPYPKPSRTLPAALDVAAFYQEGTRCLTENQPGAVAFAKLLNATYGTHTYGILRKCAAEHGEGRALDWMIDSTKPDNLALANALTRWLAAPDAQGRPGAMARRFGINYIIFNRQMWKAWAPERGWTPYYGVSPHTDHIHFSFNWDGAYKRTSWWSGVAVTTPLTGPTGSPTTTDTPPAAVTASGYPLLAQGATGADVKTAQKALGVIVDGSFGPATAAALGTWQAAHRLPATLKLDGPTWATMVYLGVVPARSGTLSDYSTVVLRRGSTGAAVKALQKALGGLTVDGSFGPATETRVKAYQASKGLAATGVTDRALWFALMGAVVTTATPAPTPAPTPTTPAPTTNPLTKYQNLTLKLWSKGEAVKALQKAIGKLTVDGSYGRLTEARVKEYQKAKRLAVTGVTDAKVWKALIADSTPTSTPTTPAPTTPTPAPTTPTPTTPAPTTPAPTVPTSLNSPAFSTEFTDLKATVLKPGATGAAVKVLQRALGGLAVDGTYSSGTQAAVKRFQTAKKLTVTGVVDRRTWDALELAVHPLMPYWGTILKPGSTGAAVVALQKALRLTADGTYTTSTAAAVKAAQRNARITQTGVVGIVTWRAIEASLPR